MKLTKKELEEIRNDPVGFIESIDSDEAIDILNQLSDAYYNTDTPLVSDRVFDLLYDTFKSLDPTNNYFKTSGADIKVEKNKVELKYPMGSLDKFKPDNVKDIEEWSNEYNGPYVISEKLDGISAQLLYENEKYFMYTKGKGTEEGNIGEDISHLVELINIKNIDNIPDKWSIRGELIMSKKNFEKFNNKYKNIRNLVGGIVNSKTIDKSYKEIAKHIDFVAYNILNPIFTQEEQMKKLEDMKMNVVHYEIHTEMNVAILGNYFQTRRKTSNYETDGVVCVDSSKKYKLNAGNPKHAFAFKMILEDQYAISTVTKVQWEPSKDSYLKPVVYIKPINLVGATINKCTAHNARNIIQNKINVGSKVKIIRSGDVIPEILEVIKPSNTAAKPDIPCKLNDTGVDYIIDYSKKIDETILDQVRIKNLVSFFEKIKVKALGIGIITKLVENNYKTIKDIIIAEKKDLIKINGLGDKIIDKIYNEIDNKLDKVKLYTFMSATNIFGFGLGEKKFKEILKHYPNILYETWTNDEMIEKLNNIHGFSEITSSKFVEKLEEFKTFIFELNEYYNLDHLVQEHKTKTTKEKEKDLFKDEVIVFTGFRDDKLKEYIEDNGGRISTTVSKNTTLLITKGDSSSSKYKKAQELQITILDIDNFNIKYNLK